ncbi:hypothetical protein THAOC_09570, partial [Thalassiosira oceanica]
MSDPYWAPSPQLVKCGRARGGCEKTRGISKWKSLELESTGAKSCGHTVLAHARFQTAPTSLLTLQTCGGGLRLGRVKIMNSRSGTAACIGHAGL